MLTALLVQGTCGGYDGAGDCPHTLSLASQPLSRKHNQGRRLHHQVTIDDLFWAPLSNTGCVAPRGAIKKLFFLLSVKRGEGVCRPNQKIFIRKYSDFFDQRGGGSHPIQKGFIRFFGIICQKMGVLYKKNGSFLTIFRRKGGGSGPSQKILIR